MDCIERCPVDCFYAGENMLVIHPDEGIDCGACEPECPAEAIKPDTETGLESWLKLNEEFSAKWPNSPSRRAPGRCERMGRRAGQAALSQQRTARGLARAEAAAQDEERKACAVIFRLSPKVALAADEVCIEALARAQYERLHPEDTFDDLERRAFR